MTKWQLTTALAALLLAVPVAAQDWTAEWRRVVAEAEKEGELVINSQANQAARDFLQREWPKAYPKIALSVSVFPEPQILARVRTERQAEKYLWDASVAVSSAGYAFAKEGALDPLLPELIDPNVNRPELWGGWDEAFVDAAKKYVFSVTAYVASPFYNAAMIAPEKIARLGLKAMIDPEYAGKIAWHEPTIAGGGRTYAQLLHAQLGEDGLRKLLLDQKTVFVQQQHQVVEAMARGTAWIGIGPPVRSLIQPYLQAGVKTDVRPFGNTPDRGVVSIGGSAVYIFNRRPHPNATKVFVNWLMSRDVQHGFAKATDQRSRRTDVPETAEPDSIPVPGGKYITTQREENIEPQNETLRVIAEIRRAAR
jgi:ABC-type Fe3+ transport system substrate-binding protein